MTNPKTEKSITQGKVDLLDKLMLFAIAVVVLGLVVETLIDFIPGTGPALLLVFHRTGSVLVTIGVAAELLIEFKHGKHSGRLREINESLIDDSNKCIAALNADTERMRTENLILREYRSFGDPAAVQAALGEFAGTEFAVEYQDKVHEAASFAWEIVTYLNNAKWTIAGGTPRPVAQLAFGVAIVVPFELRETTPREPTAALALAEYLDARQIATSVGIISPKSRPPFTVLVQIGPRPETIVVHENIRSRFAKDKASQKARLMGGVV